MVRPVGERAHLGDAGVEKVVWMTGPIGDAAAKHEAAFDDGHPNIGVPGTQKMCGHQYTTGSAANNDYVIPAIMLRQIAVHHVTMKRRT
jgi:hypothetical protein